MLFWFIFPGKLNILNVLKFTGFIYMHKVTGYRMNANFGALLLGMNVKNTMADVRS